MIQKMVGAGIPKAKKKFNTYTNPTSPANIIVVNVGWKHYEAIVDPEYSKKWYPEELWVENKGHLSLISAAFIRWSYELMIYAINFFTERNMIKYRNNCVRVVLFRLAEHDQIFGLFEEASLTINGISNFDNNTMKKIHNVLAKQASNAYTGFWWVDKFKGDKDLSDDKNNVAFQQMLQTTGNDGSNASRTPTRKKRSLEDDLVGALPYSQLNIVSPATTSNI